MPIIERIGKLKTALRKLSAKGKEASQASVTIGFTQNYALVVHELHRTKSKFLEDAARNNVSEIVRVVRTAYKSGVTMEKSLLLGGLRLQRDAQLRTPVDTGALKASAFTAITREADMAASSAFEASEVIRKRGK